MKKVFLYCRKSSEGEDRQMLSIPSQLGELTKLAAKLDLNIVKTFTEAKSAKAPGRMAFAEMMVQLHEGKAEGILCWKLDRLARNPVDGGAIIWSVKDVGIEIITPSQTYSHQNENTLLMYLEFGMAQKFIDDLGKNAKRGMKTKAEMGWYPSLAPIGYKNDPYAKKGLKTISKDDDSFELVKRCFYEILKGKQASKVWRLARDQWGFKSKHNRPLNHSTFYNVLNNPFYYGEYEWPKNSGNWYQGKHEPMITIEQFDVVQKMLGNKGRPISRSHTFDLTGLLRCSICGCAITATKKVKLYKRTGRTAEYIYYHCTKKNPEIKCTQPPINEKDLENAIMAKLIALKPPEEFVSWAKRWIKTVHTYESHTEEEVLASQHREIESVEKKLNNLLDLRLSGDLDDSIYKDKKNQLEKEKRRVKKLTDKSENNLTNLRLKVEKAIDIAYGSYLKFKTGNRDSRHEILMSISSNLVLDHKKVRIDLLKPFEAFENQENWEKKYGNWLEPQKYTDLFDKMPDLKPTNPVWLPREESNL